MIDFKVLRDDPQAFYKAVQRKGADIDVDELMELDDQRKEYLQRAETLRRTQNEANQKIASEQDAGRKSELIAEMKAVSNELKLVDEKLNRATETIEKQLIAVPNPPHESVPDGGEDDFETVKTVNDPRNFTFEPRDHEELGQMCDLIDTTRGAKCSGSRFYFLKNEAVLLEFALAQYILGIVLKQGFTPMLTPQLVRESAMYGTGFFPADRNEVYEVNPSTEANPEGDDLFLIGTSEVPLTMYHSDEIIDVEKPQKFIGWSTCFRREAGSYGKDTKGVFRVHQFNKLEMYCLCKPEDSWQMHEELRGVEEEIMQGLGLPYRVINLAAGDLGAPAAKKYDIEVYIPTQKKYRELTSCSNCTDYQARRANIRHKTETGTAFVHTLNGTACAMTRMLIAIMENYQNEDGSITVPEVLRSYLGKDTIGLKN